MKIAAALCIASSLLAQSAVERPKVLGVAHMAIYVKDLAKTRQFYTEFLGFAEPFTLPTADGSGVRIAFVKVNDEQYIEIFTEKDRGEGQLNHISFHTDSADRMYAYLKSKGVPVLGDRGVVPKGMTGNKNFNVKDPDGHIVEMVEYQPDSWTAREKGKFMPATRISDRILHVGVLAGELDESVKFYGGILGFKEFWRGSSTPHDAELGEYPARGGGVVFGADAVQQAAGARQSGDAAPRVPGRAGRGEGAGGAPTAGGEGPLPEREADGDPNGRQSEAADQFVRPRRDADRADGAEHGGRAAGAEFDRSGAAWGEVGGAEREAYF